MERFTEEKDELLIKLVKRNSLIYDPGDKNYKNNISKYKVWENISERLDIPVSDCKKRWKHFRDHYNKKMKSEHNIMGAMNTWRYMTHLSFLSGFQTKREPLTNEDLSTRDSFDNDNTQDDTIEDYVNKEIPVNPIEVTNTIETYRNELPDADPLPSSSTGRKRRKMQEPYLTELFLDRDRSEMFNALSNSQPEPRNPIRKFFESMAEVVMEFPPSLVAETRLKVCQVVTEMELKFQNQHAASFNCAPKAFHSDESTD